MHDNALCMGTADIDAKSRKIRCVALPDVDNDDVAKKRYVIQSVKILKDRQDENEKELQRSKITCRL